MSEEKKENQDSSSSEESEKVETTEPFDPLSLFGLETLDAKKKFVTVKFEIPLECEQRLDTINIPKSEDGLMSYLLDQIKQFFAERNAQLSATKTPTETTLKSPETKLKITYEDQPPRKRYEPYPKRSPFRATGIRPESSSRNENEDSSSSSSTLERSRSPIVIPSEPLPSFDSTFQRPLINLYKIPPTSASMSPKSESSISSETYASIAMDFSQTVQDESVDTAMQIASHHPSASGNTYAENLSTIFMFLLQDLEELKKFTEGFQLNPDEPSTSGVTTSFEELAAISEHFGTGVESNAAIATRDYLRDADSSINSSVEAIGLSDYSAVNPAHQAVSSQERRTTPPISPVSLKGKSNGSPKKRFQPGASRTPSSPSKKIYTLKAWIDNMTITQTTIELRNLIVYARVNFNSCVVNAEEILALCRKSLPEEILPNLEILVAGCVNVLEQLVRLRRECSFLLRKCPNRHNNEGITYILKVKTQIGLRYHELVRLLLQRLLDFRYTCDKSKET